MSKKKRERWVIPLPEIIHQGRWKVYEGGVGEGKKSRVDIKSRKIQIPLGVDDLSLGIRAHEYAHIKWSPSVYPEAKSRVNTFAINSAEDARIEHLCEKSGIDETAGAVSEEMADAIIEKMNMDTSLFKRACMYTAVEGARQAKRMREELLMPDKLKKYCEEILTDLRKEADTFTGTIHASEKLMKLYDETEGKEKTPMSGVSPSRFPFSETVLNDDEASDGLIGVMKRMGLIPSRIFRMWDDEHDRGWARMTIETPQLKKRVAFAPAYTIKKSNSDFGMVFYRMDRYVSDERVFKMQRRKKTPPAGTILIDGSGSMSTSMEDVYELINASAGVKVALYGGESNPSGGDDSHGKLWVLADKGLAVNNIPREKGYYLNNMIDLPALKWLAKQEAPRVWLSDGGVTGSGEMMTESLRRQVGKFLKESGIIWVRGSTCRHDLIPQMKSVLDGTIQSSDISFFG